MLKLLTISFLLTACGSSDKADGDTSSPSPADSLPLDSGGGGEDGPDEGSPDGGDTGEFVEGSGPTDFIGAPCSTDADCPYDGGVCLTDGFPDGMCSLSCDNICPDQDGHPVTFCVDSEALPTGTPSGGWCVSRCDFSIYSSLGCRDEYGCVIEGRYNESWTQNYSCLPGDASDLTECHYSLADRGIAFEPTVRAPAHPDGHPDLTCEIEDPVWILAPVFGVDMKYYDGSRTPRTLAACEMAHALGDTVEGLLEYDVSSILHVGTYNCRTIAGTSSISRHGYADAIDFYGFEFTDGRSWTLIDDWEHDTTSFDTEAGRFLYEIAQSWYDDWIWNIILTPNYNLAHDNHFHVDLSPGSHYVGATDGRYFGPALYVD